MQSSRTAKLQWRKPLAQRVGGLNADALLFAALEYERGFSQTRDFVRVNDEVCEFVQVFHVNFPYCLSEVGCGIIRGGAALRSRLERRKPLDGFPFQAALRNDVEDVFDVFPFAVRYGKDAELVERLRVRRSTL